MTRQKTAWFCTECGHKQVKWLGQCPSCSSWNTLQEEIDLSSLPKRFTSEPLTAARPIRITEIPPESHIRMETGFLECDRLFGGGLAKGSLTLVGGDPGIGKSTLLLQLSHALANRGLTVLYVCGEESVAQTSLRAKRLGIASDQLFLLSETQFSLIKAQIEQLNPDVLVIDSIQILYKHELSSAPGSVSQVRETATELMHLTKNRQMTTFLIGHVTKSGDIAGPRVLEHLVDTVLYFEGDKQHLYRLVRVVKNRFGPTDEIALFLMKSQGLVEVSNPSELFLEERRHKMAGSAIIPTLEGSRPILVEVQALVTETAFSTPSRRSTGLDQNRLALLLAVLEKRMGYHLHRCDVFLAVAGGLKIYEPAIDLGVLLATASSLKNFPMPPHTVLIGEVGLGGEVRSVPRMENRLKGAIQMGFQEAILPKRNVKGLSEEIRKKLVLKPVEEVGEAIGFLFG